MTYTIITCILFMAFVAWYSYRRTRNTISDSDGYFLAGRGLTGGFIAGSLVLTNLSAEQLVGLNGQSYNANMSNMAWEVTAGISVIILALVLLPRYIGGAFTTLPEFVNSRFDEGTRMMVTLLFMLGYTFVTIPSVLYSGAIAVLQLFDVPALLGMSLEQSMWIVIWVVGIIGAAYAIFGGLKAVAISDTLNGVGLLVIGLLIPLIGFHALGDGNMLAGMKTIATEEPEKLNAIGSSEDSVPFGTIFTGMIFANLFYWGTNQYVIQRTLGAKSLAEGQKGTLFTGFLKILVPFMMMIPGIIAYHLYGQGNDTSQQMVRYASCPRFLLHRPTPAACTGRALEHHQGVYRLLQHPGDCDHPSRHILKIYSSHRCQDCNRRPCRPLLHADMGVPHVFRLQF